MCSKKKRKVFSIGEVVHWLGLNSLTIWPPEHWQSDPGCSCSLSSITSDLNSELFTELAEYHWVLLSTAWEPTAQNNLSLQINFACYLNLATCSYLCIISPAHLKFSLKIFLVFESHMTVHRAYLVFFSVLSITPDGAGVDAWSVECKASASLTKLFLKPFSFSTYS